MTVIRDSAAVTVGRAVNGSNRRRPPKVTRSRAVTVNRVTVDPAVMATARRVMRPGERLVIESATAVMLVPVTD